LFAVEHDDFYVAKLLLNNVLVNPAAKNNVAIRIAVSRSNHSMVILLLSSDRVDPTAELNSAIGIAMLNEDIVMMRILLNDYRMVKTGEDARNILYFAVREFKGNTKPLEFLMNHPKLSGPLVTGLFIPAVTENRLDLVRWLLTQRNVDPTADGYWALLSAVRQGQHDIVQCFLEDARVDAGFNNNVFLFMAIIMRDHRMFEIVLNQEKTNPDDKDGMFLMMAVELGEYFMAERLLKKMTNPSGNGNIALSLALRKKDLKMIKILLSHQNISVSVQLSVYYPPIYLAIETGDLEIVKALVEHPKFCESTEMEIMAKSIVFAQTLKYAEIASYLKTINVTGDAQNRSSTLINPRHQLTCRMILLEELVFWHDMDYQSQVTLEFKHATLRTKLNSLLAELFLGEANSTQLGTSRKPCFELLKLTFADFQANHGGNLTKVQMKNAFRKFVTDEFSENAESTSNGPPTDLKRKREEGQPAANRSSTGEQEPPRPVGEASSSEPSDRNVRRRLDLDADSGESENGSEREGNGERGVEAGKEPENA
jgi:hypothetical protein